MHPNKTINLAAASQWQTGAVDVVVVVLDLQLPIQSGPITTKVVSSNPRSYGEVYSIQHFVIMFISNLRQVGDFLRVLLFPPPIKLTAMI